MCVWGGITKKKTVVLWEQHSHNISIIGRNNIFKRLKSRFKRVTCHKNMIWQPCVIFLRFNKFLRLDILTCFFMFCKSLSYSFFLILQYKKLDIWFCAKNFANTVFWIKYVRRRSFGGDKISKIYFFWITFPPICIFHLHSTRCAHGSAYSVVPNRSVHIPNKNRILQN